MRKSSIARLGFGAFFAAASAAGAACNPAFNSYNIVGAASDHGHTVIQRGTDNVIRISEFDESTGNYGGWLVLTKTSEVGGSSYTDPWIQAPVTGQGNFAYAVKGDSLIQWRLAQYYSTWAVFRSGVTGASGMTGRPASAQLSSTIKTAVIANFNGTLKYRTQNPTTKVWSSWVAIPGISNAAGSPWAVQVSSSVVNVYTRTSDQKIAQAWWNGSAWAFAGSPVASGVNSDPASIYSASQFAHHLYHVNTSGVVVKSTYIDYWSSTTIPNFPAKKSLAPVQIGADVKLYGQDYSNNTFESVNIGGTPTTFEANCVIAKP